MESKRIRMAEEATLLEETVLVMALVTAWASVWVTAWATVWVTV